MFSIRGGWSKKVAISAIVVLYLGLIYFGLANLLPVQPISPAMLYAGLTQLSSPGQDYPLTNTLVIATHNSGESWTQVYTDPKASSFSLSCPAVNTCFVLANSSKLLRTSDGGKTWESQPITLNGPDKEQIVEGIACPTVLGCFGLITGDKASAYFGETGDNGKTWHQSEIDLNGVAVLDFSCPTSTHCLLVGQKGLLMSTSDGGKSWIKAKSVTSQSVYRVGCLTSQHCLALARGGIILGTEDGGLTWLSYPSGIGTKASEELHELNCTGPEKCFALGFSRGSSGTYLTSFYSVTEAGAELITQFEADEDFYGLACPTQQNCFVAGAGGTIKATHDGGKTWRAQSSGTTETIFRISCPDLASCYAITVPDEAD